MLITAIARLMRAITPLSLRHGLGARASVSIMVAFGSVPLAVGSSVAVDFATLASAHGRLQAAVDNAALSGAAAWTSNTTSAQTRAVVSATSAFCTIASTLPSRVALLGGGPQSCISSSSTGPTVATQIGGYKAGTQGITPSACSATNPVVTGVRCGFIVTVSAQAKMTSTFSTLIGGPYSISATATAANPFLNIGTDISAVINGSAFNTNNLWLYPLLLDNNGNPDYTTNLGAIPGLVANDYPSDAAPYACASLTSCGQAGTPAGVNCVQNAACTNTGSTTCDNPAVFICGNFTMIASTAYNTATNPCLPIAPCYPNGAGTYPKIVQGVIQSPQAPAIVITATTPIGVALSSIAGGNNSYGYMHQWGSGTPIQGSNNCYAPDAAAYNTVAQIYSNGSATSSGGSYNAGASTPALDWPKVTHWFYSSYLANNLPPSQGEIFAQSQSLTYTPPGGGSSVSYNVRVPTVGMDSTGQFVPTIATCKANASNGNSYDQFLTTTYPATGSTNRSLYILNQPAGSAYTLPSATGYNGQTFTPATTPGAQYSTLTCQSSSNRVISFYWNDMGGSWDYGDDLDYANGTLRVQCTGASYVVLIG